MFQSLTALFENGRQFLDGSGAEHGDARLPEVGNTLEDGRGSQMATRVQYAPILVYAFYVDAHLLFENVNLVIYRKDSVSFK